MALYPDSSNSYSYFDENDTSRGGYDFSEMKGRPYDFEMLPPQNLDEYLIQSFSGSFGLDSVVSEASNADYDTLALVSRKGTSGSGSYSNGRRRSTDSKQTRKISTPGNGAYDTPAAFFADYLSVTPAAARTAAPAAKTTKRNSSAAKRNSGAATAATAADNNADFKFGMQAFLHSQQLGFGRQPSFRRVGTEDAQSAQSAPRRTDYFFEFDDKIFGAGTAAKTTPSTRRGSSASRGHATPASNAAELDMYKKWIDTLEASSTNKLEGSTANRSVKASSRPSRSPQTSEGGSIAPDFKREVDFLMRGILGDIELTHAPQNDAHSGASHMWTNLDSFLSGSVTTGPQKPAAKPGGKSVTSPLVGRPSDASTSKRPSVPTLPVRTRPRASDSDAPVATVHYAFPSSNTNRKPVAPKEATVEDYFIDPSWVNGETTPLSRSASATGEYDSSRRTSQMTTSSSCRLSVHTEDDGPAPSSEPTVPAKTTKQAWKRIPKPQVTASTSKLAIASIPNNGLGTLQRSPTKVATTHRVPAGKSATSPSSSTQPAKSAAVPLRRGSGTPGSKTPHTPGDPLTNMEYPSAEGLRASGMDVKVDSLPFFPSASTESMDLKGKKGTMPAPQGILNRASVPNTAGNRPSPPSKAQNRRASVRNDRSDSQPQSQLPRRRLSEFKNAAGDTGMAASFSVSRTEDAATQKATALSRQKAAQKANEERKERVQAFLARRKKEKAEAERERIRQKEAREAEQSKAVAASVARRAKNNGTPPAGSAANAVRGRQQRTALVKPEPSRQSIGQSLPAAPYLEGNGVLHTSASDSVEVNRVRGVLINVVGQAPPNVRSSVTLTAKDASTIEVRHQRDGPRFFNVSEYIDYSQSSGKNLSSVTLSEMVRKFLAGINTALLLSSTPGGARGVEASITEVVSAVVRHRPASSQLFMSVVLLYGGMTEDLLAPPGSALKPSTFVHAPMFGSVVDNVGYLPMQSARDVSRWVSTGLDKSTQARGQNRDAVLVVSFILKQVKNQDVILSSLLITDAPVGVYGQVLRKLDCSPYQLFHGVLGGPTFTLAVFSVSPEDTDVVQMLNTHHKLANITNKPAHLGSVLAFKRLAEKEMRGSSSQAEGASSKSSRHPNLAQWISEADRALKNPTTYVPRPTPEEVASRSRSASPAGPVPLKGSSSAAATTSLKPAKRPQAGQESRAGLASHNSASVMSPKASAQRLPSEMYINRGPSAAPNYGNTGFINLDDSTGMPTSLPGPKTTKAPAAGTQRSSKSGADLPSQKTLPGAAAVNADGPAWPAQQPLRPPPLVPTKSATEDAIITVASMSGSSFSSSNASGGDRRAAGGTRHSTSEVATTLGSTDDDDTPPSATRVRTMVVVDPLCKESSNVTFENKMVIATIEDDFEEYDVDEVLEMNLTSKEVQSTVLNELCDMVLSGCNAALLGGDSRSYAASPQILRIAVKRILNGISQRGAKRYGNLSVSIVRVKGKTMTDLLVPNSEPKKLVVAISPIFGSCVHGVEFKQVSSSVAFDAMLKKALDTAASKHERDMGFICCSFILKLKLEDEKDVLVSSLVACFAGENVGLYTSVLDQSPLVPRALFHYALGGPCFTVSLLGIGGDETRANLMLQVQRSLGQTNNRITHPGSISKFVGGIRNELAPAMMQKLNHGESESEREKTREILDRLTEIVKDAEALLRDFDNHEPKAYLNSDEDKDEDDSMADAPRGVPATAVVAQGRRSLPKLVVKDGVGNGGGRGAARVSGDDDTRIRSLVCLEERMMGGGSVTVSDGAAVLVKTRNGGGVRFDADEVVTRNGGNTSLDSALIDGLVDRFLRGHHTGLVTADSSNCAFTPLMLRKIAYQVVALMRTGLDMKPGQLPKPITGELRVSMALVKDGLIADLLPIEEHAEVMPFSVEYNPIAGPVLSNVVSHLVPSAEDFDRLLAAAIDNADPSLQTADPGIMVVSLALTQCVTQPKEDVLVSSLLCTAVFDAVHHYTAALSESPDEPLDLFRFILGGASHTVALMGICDEDDDPDNLLNVLSSLSAVRNRPSHPNSVAKYIADLQQSILKLHEVMAKTSSQDEKNYISSRLDLATQMLREAETVLRYPLSYMKVHQQNQLTFVPLGSSMPPQGR